MRDERPAVLDVSTKSTATDVVTEMDHRSEQWIVERILEVRPNDAILGEEGGERSGSSGVRWVIDPLDGTVNYLYGLPGWAVSVGVEHDGVTLAGAVAIPMLDQVYSASRGGGAWCDGRRLQCSSASELDAALIGTGFGYAAQRRIAQGEVLAGVIGRVRDIRRAGAAAVDLCWVAAGLLDGYYERGLQPWDLSAGQLIVEEAGGVVSGLRGVEASAAMVVAAGPALHGPLTAMLEELTADRG